MLSLIRLARTLSLKTWCHRSGYVNALGTLVQKQTISTRITGVSKTTKTAASKAMASEQSDEFNKQIDIRSPPRNSKRFWWTDEKDVVLREGIAKHRKDGWAMVAEFVGGGVKDHQCKNRAIFLEGLEKKEVKRGAWEQDELRRLEELVPQYLVRSYWSKHTKKMTKEYTDWKGVGKELGRLPIDCKSTWNNLQCVNLKKGRFTAEEDALIRQRVAERKGEGTGLWTALQKEMSRSPDAIQRRWNAFASRFKHADTAICWSAELDERLKEGVTKHKAESWAKVAEYVDGGVTADQCRQRWNTYLEHGNVKRGAWDQDEVGKLTELVPQYLVPSYLSKYTGRMTIEYTDWTKVAAKLGRLPIDCQTKWVAIRTATMKKGRFTDSENAMIRQRVEGWGDNKTSGLWVGLQKDLGRPATRIREQWVNVLSNE